MIDKVAVFDAGLAEEEINYIITRGLENWQPGGPKLNPHSRCFTVLPLGWNELYIIRCKKRALA